MLQDANIIVSTIDKIVLYSFALEIILKLLCEGLSPSWFLRSPKERNWNIFDTVVVVACLPFIPIPTKQIAMLRLMRLARLGKLFKRIPQLQMIIGGLYGGLKSIVYILVLLLLTFYIYAVAGIIFFGGNDPFRFRSVEVSMLTMLSILTFDGWGDMMYTQYYGCDTYGLEPDNTKLTSR